MYLNVEDLKSEFLYYLANKPEFLKQHPGKFIAIKNKEIVGVYDDRLEAIRETAKNHQLGSFIVQHVTEEEDQIRYLSRVAV